MEKTIKGTVSRTILLKGIFSSEDFMNCDKHGDEEFSKNEDFYLSELNSEQSFCYYLSGESGLLAFILFRKLFDEIDILHWAVKDKGKGLGKLYLQQFFYEMSPVFNKINLEVNLKNKAALKVYGAFDFARGPLRKEYYGPGQDGVHMTKNFLEFR